MHRATLDDLLQRYIANTATPEELEQLWTLVAGTSEEKLNELLERSSFQQPAAFRTSPNTADEVFKKVMAEAAVYNPEQYPASIPFRKSSMRRIGWIGYAAAVLIMLCAGIYLWKAQSEKAIVTGPVLRAAGDSPGIFPGSEKAVLTLGNGQQIKLDPSSRDTIRQGKLVINNADGGLVYTESDMVTFNTMTTPKGGQYRLTLPDGTRVWLNAASSIHYPTAFKDKNRIVTLLGEAYFEVSPNKDRPFLIKTKDDSIRVLGTSFNVNAYPDEDIKKTSLVEGSVKVGTVILKPGQAFANGSVLQTSLQQDLAWKNGVFDFNDLHLRQVMRQLSRWYDIDVEYEPGVPDTEFGGKMSRDLPIGDVLEFLKGSKIHFRVEGRRLIVLP